MNLAASLKHYYHSTGGRVAASIRIVTTENPSATQRDLVEAVVALGFAAGTARIQYNKARREDAAFETMRKEMDQQENKS